MTRDDMRGLLVNQPRPNSTPKIETMRKALRQLLDETEPQPIETAPKDRGFLGLYDCFYGEREWFHTRWNADTFNSRPRPFWDGELARLQGRIYARQHPPIMWLDYPAVPKPPADQNVETKGM